MYLMIYKSYVLRSIQYDTIAYIILNQNKCSNMSEKKVLELNIQIQNSGHTMRLREIKHEFYRWNTKKTKPKETNIQILYPKRQKIPSVFNRQWKKWRGTKKKNLEIMPRNLKNWHFWMKPITELPSICLFIVPRQLLHSTRISPIKLEINNMMLNSARSGVIFFSLN